MLVAGVVKDASRNDYSIGCCCEAFLQRLHVPAVLPKQSSYYILNSSDPEQHLSEVDDWPCSFAKDYPLDLVYLGGSQESVDARKRLLRPASKDEDRRFRNDRIK